MNNLHEENKKGNFILTLKDRVTDEGIEYLVELAYKLEFGEVFKQDTAQALFLYDLCASTNGNPWAFNNIAEMYRNGKIVAEGEKPNILKAIGLYEEAAKQGFPLAMVNLGNIYDGQCGEEYRDYKKALKYYKEASDLGDVKGMFNYANCLHNGWGTKKDPKKAFAMFSALADMGKADAYFYVGIYYQEGLAGEQDYNKAKHYYLLGASREDKQCCNQLGVMFGKGLGVKKDPLIALEYYKMAAEYGDSLAYVNIAWYFETGTGVEADMDAALRGYLLAAYESEPQAFIELERILQGNPPEVKFDRIKRAAVEAVFRRVVVVSDIEGAESPKERFERLIAEAISYEDSGEAMVMKLKPIISEDFKLELVGPNGENYSGVLISVLYALLHRIADGE